MKAYGIVVVVAWCFLGLLQSAEAVTYKYIDKNGMICFADDIQSIPEQYRSQAILIEGEQKEPRAGTDSAPAGTGRQAAAPAPVVAPAASPVLEAAPAPRRTTRPLSRRLAVTLAIGAGLIVLTVLLGKMRTFSDDRVARISLRTGAMGIFLLYLVVAHRADIVTVAQMAGKAVDDVQLRSAQKGQRAAEGMKKLDAMFEQLQAAEDTLRKEQEQEQAANNH